MNQEDPRVTQANAEKAEEDAPKGFAFFGGRTEKWENAAALWSRAANSYRARLQHIEAAKAFERAANIQETKLNEPMDMANTLTEAYKSYKNAESPDDAARVLQQAISYYTTAGNFRRAATHQTNLAELYEGNFKPPKEKEALAAYEIAARWFEADNADALANKYFLKVAELAAMQGDYNMAITKFEGVAKSSINHNLMKWSVKEYFLKAGFCHLAVGDNIATRRAIEQYQQLDNSFRQQRECMLLKDLVQCQEDGDSDLFSTKLEYYDKLSTLDPWKTAVLVKAKQGIAKKQDDEEDFS